MPGERLHPPELRETTCAVALKWLLRRGVHSHSRGGGSGSDGGVSSKDRDEDKDKDAAVVGGVGGGGGGVDGGATERALKYRRCGRELFTRLLASGECVCFRSGGI